MGLFMEDDEKWLEANGLKEVPNVDDLDPTEVWKGVLLGNINVTVERLDELYSVTIQDDENNVSATGEAFGLKKAFTEATYNLRKKALSMINVSNLVEQLI